MASSLKKSEQLDRARARIVATTPEDLAVSFEARREFGESYGYRDAADWFATEQARYPELFKGENAIVRPAWVVSAPAPAAAAPAPKPAFVPATDKQISFARSLMAECDQDADLSAMDRRAVSKYIDELKAMPRAARKPVERVELEDGMYRTADGSIFKVKHSVGSGRQYAQKLVRDVAVGNVFGAVDQGRWKFEYAPGACRTLRPEQRMTLEEAKAFGALYGTCCVCGRTLSNEESIAAGIGPICAAGF